MGEKSKKNNKPQKRPLTYGAKGVDVTLGHQHCVPGGRFYRVPREMGWLWTSRDVPGLKFRPDWRPGAVRRSVARMIKRYGRNAFDSGPDLAAKFKKRLASKTALAKAALGKNVRDERIAPTFVIKNVDGDYFVTLQELKDIKTRKVTDYPYTDGPPYKFRVLNSTPDEMEKIERNRVQSRKYAEKILFQEVFDNICKEIFNNIDRDELCNYASQRNTCVCQALQAEILNSFTGSLCDAPEVCSSTEKQSPCGEEEWTIEFTPPVARFDPNRKTRERFNKATQFEVRTVTDDDDENGNKWKRESSLDHRNSLENQDTQDTQDKQDTQDTEGIGDDGLDKTPKKKRIVKGRKKPSKVIKKEVTGVANFISDKGKFEECIPIDDTCCVCPACYVHNNPCCYGYYFYE